MSGLVKMMTEDAAHEANEDVPLSDVKSGVLAKVMEFCKHHVDQRLPEIEKVRLPVRAPARTRLPERAPVLTALRRAKELRQAASSRSRPAPDRNLRRSRGPCSRFPAAAALDEPGRDRAGVGRQVR